MTDENPYEPPANGQTAQRSQGRKEGTLVRSMHAGLALCLIAFMSTFDVRRMTDELWVAVAVFSYLTFTCAFVAATGRWFSLERLFRGPT